MRYKIIFPLECGEVVSLGDTDLTRAIGFAKRIAEDDWFEIVDTSTSNIIASSESERNDL